MGRHSLNTGRVGGYQTGRGLLGRPRYLRLGCVQVLAVRTGAHMELLRSKSCTGPWGQRTEPGPSSPGLGEDTEGGKESWEEAWH